MNRSCSGVSRQVRRLSRIGFASFFLIAGGAAFASGYDLTSLQNLTQPQFHDLAQDLGAALSFKPLEPAEPLNVSGFDLGVAVSATPLAHTAAYQNAVSDNTVYSTLPVPQLRVALGLPDNVDVGGMYSKIPGSNITLYGADVKWAFLPGGFAIPSVALRGAVTRIDGVDQLGFETYSADISVSQGFTFITPYGGVGEVRSRAATDGLPLSLESINQSKIFGGVDFNLGLANLVFEADSTGGIKTYSAKVGVRF